MLADTRAIFKDHGGLVVICFLLIFFSIFGQSVFFGVYLPMIQEELGLSKTAIGGLYAQATIASALVIIFTGKGLDHFPLRNFIALTLGGLALGCFIMAGAYSSLMLFLAFFLLRQFGQGLLVLSANTSINRYLTKGRGKALALSSLGASVQIMVFPLLALTLDQYVNWRDAWMYFGVFILCILLPGFWFSLRAHQQKTHANWAEQLAAEQEKKNDENTPIIDQWTSKHVLRDWRFYGIVAISTISPFIGTVIFFYQRELGSALSFTPVAFASSFSFFTISAMVSSLSTGAVIDQYGEKSALITYPILYALGLYLLTSGGGNMILFYVGMTALGCATGIMGTIGGPLLAKLYGTKHLGSVKSLLFSTSILASALSPFIFGLLIDKGIDILTLFASAIYYSGIVWILAFPICSPRKQK